MPSLSKNDVTITITTKGDTTGVKNVSSALDGLEETGNRLKTFGSEFKSAGESLTKYITLPLVAAGTVALNAGINFDRIATAMEATARASGATEEEIAGLRDTAMDFGSRGIFGPTQVASAMLDMIRDGVIPAGENIDRLRGVYALAAAQGEDLADVQIMVSDAMEQFGLTGNDTMRFVDGINNMMNVTSAEMGHFADAFKFANTSAAAMGMTFEETFAVLSAFSDAGLKGTIAGTGLRRILDRLIAPTDEAKSALDQLGISIFDSDGNMRKFSNVIGDFQSAMSGLTSEQQAQALSDIFGVQGVTPMRALLLQGADGLERFELAMRDVGTAEKIAEERQKSLSGSWDTFRAAMERGNIEMSNANKGPLVGLLGFLTDIANAFADLSPETKQWITIFAGIAALAGPTLLVFGKTMLFIDALRNSATVITILKGIGGGFGVIAGAIKGLMTFVLGINPIILGIIALAGLLFLAWKGNWFGIRDHVANVVEWFKGTALPAIQNFFDGIKNFLSNTRDWFSQKFDAIKGIVQGAWDGIMGVFNTAKTNFMAWIEFFRTNFVGALGYLLGSIVGLVAGVASRIFLAWVNMWTSIITRTGMFINSVVTGIINMGKSFINAIVSLYNRIASIDWAGLGRSIVHRITSWLSGVGTSLWNSLVGAYNRVAGIDWAGLGRAILVRVGNAVYGLGGRLWNELAWAFNAILNIDWVGVGRSIIDRIGAGVRNFGGNFVQGIKNAFSSAFNFKIPGFAQGTMNAPGGLAVVGERGPEIVSLPQGAKVTPNNRTKDRLIGDAVISVNVSIGNVSKDVDVDMLIEKIGSAISGHPQLAQLSL